MAKGWTSLHPFQEQRLRAIGLNGNQITQGYGYAMASAGSHAPVGAKDGRQFGHCIDLSISYAPNRPHFDALARAGFCPFYRNWPGNYHWHVVDVAWIRNDTGIAPRHLDLPRRQVLDFLATPPRNGLVGHDALPSAWRPTEAQQAYLRRLWETGAMPDGYATPDPILKVIYPPNAGAAGVIPCAPELVNGKLRGNLAEFAEALGFEVVWNAAQRKGYVRKP